MSAIEGHVATTDRRIRLRDEDREHILFTLWVLVTFVQFRFDELLLYPLAAYFAFAAVRDRERIAPLIMQCWPILLFPLWCFASIIWAVAPIAAVKYAVYLALTMVICMHAAAWLSPRRILVSVVIATGFIGVLCFLTPVWGGNPGRGVFDSKNQQGISMAVLFIAAANMALDRGCVYWSRLIAIALIGIAGVVVMRSDSATAVLVAGGATAVAFAGAVFLREASIFRLDRLGLLFLAIAAVAAMGAVLVNTVEGNLFEALLRAFNKDTTLTGRTALWDYAEREIEERPLLGVGAGGFWRAYESPLVRRILEEAYKSVHDIFNFHNSYYEIAVHQGLIGLGLTIIAMIWAVTRLIGGVLLYGGMPFVFLGSIATAVIVRTPTEADFYKPFTLYHMLLWIAALCVVREGLNRARASRGGGAMLSVRGHGENR